MGKCSSKLERNEDSDSSFQGRGGKPAIRRSTSTKDATASAKPSKDKVEKEDVAVVKEEGAFRSGESSSQGSSLVRKRNSKATGLGLKSSPETAPASSLGHEEGIDTFHDASEELGPPSVPPSPSTKSPKLESSSFSPSKDSSLATSPPESGSNRDLASSQALSRVRLNSSSSLPPTRSPPEVPVPTLRPTLSEKVSEEAVPTEPSAVSSVSAIPSISAAPEQAEPTKVDPKTQLSAKEHETMKAFVELGDNWELVTRSPLSIIQAGKKGEPESFTTQQESVDKEAEKKMDLDDSASKITLIDVSAKEAAPVKPVFAVESEKGKVHENSVGTETTSGSLSPAALLRNEGYTVRKEPLATELKIDKPASISSRSESAGSGDFEIIRGPEDEKSTPRSPSPQISETSQPEIVDSPGEVQTAVDEECYPHFVSTPAKEVSEKSRQKSEDADIIPKSISDSPRPDEQEFTRQKSVKQIVEEIEKGAFSPTAAAKVEKAREAEPAQPARGVVEGEPPEATKDKSREIQIPSETPISLEDPIVQQVLSQGLSEDPEKLDVAGTLNLGKEEEQAAPLAPGAKGEPGADLEQPAAQEPVVESNLQKEVEVDEKDLISKGEVEHDPEFAKDPEVVEGEIDEVKNNKRRESEPQLQTTESLEDPIVKEVPSQQKAAAPLAAGVEDDQVTEVKQPAVEQQAAEPEIEKEVDVDEKESISGVEVEHEQNVAKELEVVEGEPAQVTKDKSREIGLPLETPISLEEPIPKELPSQQEAAAPLPAQVEGEPVTEVEHPPVEELVAEPELEKEVEVDDKESINGLEVKDEPEVAKELEVVDADSAEVTKDEPRGIEAPLETLTSVEEPILKELSSQQEAAAPLDAEVESEPVTEVEHPAVKEIVAEPELEKEGEVDDKESIPGVEVQHEPEVSKELEVVEAHPAEETKDETRGIELPLETPTLVEEPILKEISSQQEAAAPLAVEAEGEPVTEVDHPAVKELVAEPELEKEVEVDDKQSIPGLEVQHEPEDAKELEVVEAEPAEVTKDEPSGIEVPLETLTSVEEPILKELSSQQEAAPPLDAEVESEPVTEVEHPAVKEIVAEPELEKEGEVDDKESIPGVEVQHEPEVSKELEVVEAHPAEETKDETRGIELPLETPTSVEEPILKEISSQQEAAAPLAAEAEGEPVTEVDHPAVKELVAEPELEKEVEVDDKESIPGLEAQHEPDVTKELELVEAEPAEVTKDETRGVEPTLGTPPSVDEPIVKEVPSQHETAAPLAAEVEGEPVTDVEQPPVEELVAEPELEKEGEVDEKLIPGVKFDHEPEVPKELEVVEGERAAVTKDESRGIELPLETPRSVEEPIVTEVASEALPEATEKLDASPVIFSKEEELTPSALEEEPSPQETSKVDADPLSLVREEEVTIPLEEETSKNELETEAKSLVVEEPIADLQEDGPKREKEPDLIREEEGGDVPLETEPEGEPEKEDKASTVEEKIAVLEEPEATPQLKQEPITVAEGEQEPIVLKKPEDDEVEPAEANEDDSKEIQLHAEPMEKELEVAPRIEPEVVNEEEDGKAPLDVAREKDQLQEEKPQPVDEPVAAPEEPVTEPELEKEVVEDEKESIPGVQVQHEPDVAKELEVVEGERAEVTKDESREIELSLETPRSVEDTIAEDVPSQQEAAAPLAAAEVEGEPVTEVEQPAVEERVDKPELEKEVELDEKESIPGVEVEHEPDVAKELEVVKEEPAEVTKDENREIEQPFETPTSLEDTIVKNVPSQDEAGAPLTAEVEGEPVTEVEQPAGEERVAEPELEKEVEVDDKEPIPGVELEPELDVAKELEVVEGEPGELTKDESRAIELPLETPTSVGPIVKEVPSQQEAGAPLDAEIEGEPVTEVEQPAVEELVAEPELEKEGEVDEKESIPEVDVKPATNFAKELEVVEGEPAEVTKDESRGIPLPLETPTSVEEPIVKEVPSQHEAAAPLAAEVEGEPVREVKQPAGEEPVAVPEMEKEVEVDEKESIPGLEVEPEPDVAKELEVVEGEPPEVAKDESRGIELLLETPTSVEEPIVKEVPSQQEAAPPLDAEVEGQQVTEVEQPAGGYLVAEPELEKEVEVDEKESIPGVEVEHEPGVAKELDVVEGEPAEATKDERRGIVLPLETPKSVEELIVKEVASQFLPEEKFDAGRVILAKEEEGTPSLETDLGREPGTEVEGPADEELVVEPELKKEVTDAEEDLDRDEKPNQHPGVVEEKPVNKSGEVDVEGGEEGTVVPQAVQKEPPVVELEPTEVVKDETRKIDVPLETRTGPKEPALEALPGESLPQDVQNVGAGPMSLEMEEEVGAPLEAAPESDSVEEKCEGAGDEPLASQGEPAVNEPELNNEVDVSEIEKDDEVLKEPDFGEVKPGEVPQEDTRAIELPLEPNSQTAEPEIQEERAAPWKSTVEVEPENEESSLAVEEPTSVQNEPEDSLELEKEITVAGKETITTEEAEKVQESLQEPDYVKEEPVEAMEEAPRVELPLEPISTPKGPALEEEPSPQEPSKVDADPLSLVREEEVTIPLEEETPKNELETEAESSVVEEPIADLQEVGPKVEKGPDLIGEEEGGEVPLETEPEGEPEKEDKASTVEEKFAVLEEPQVTPQLKQEPITVAEGEQEPIVLKKPEDDEVEPAEANEDDSKEIKLPAETMEKELEVAARVEPEVVNEEEDGTAALEVAPENDPVKEEKSQPVEEPVAAQEEPLTEPEVEQELDGVGNLSISLEEVDEAPEPVKEQQAGKEEPVEAIKNETREFELPVETSPGLGESISEDIPSQVIHEEPEEVQDDPQEEALATPLPAAPEIDFVKEEELKSVEEPIPAQVESQVDPELEKGLEEAVKADPEVLDKEEKRTAHLEASPEGDPQNEKELTTVEEPTAAQEETGISQELEKEAEMAAEEPIAVLESDCDPVAFKKPEVAEVEPAEAKKDETMERNLPFETPTTFEEPMLEDLPKKFLEEEPKKILANPINLAAKEEGPAPLKHAPVVEPQNEEEQPAEEEPRSFQEEPGVQAELEKNLGFNAKGDRDEVDEGAALRIAPSEGDSVRDEAKIPITELWAAQEEPAVGPELEKDFEVAANEPIKEAEIEKEQKDQDFKQVEPVEDPNELTREVELPLEPMSTQAEPPVTMDGLQELEPERHHLEPKAVKDEEAAEADAPEVEAKELEKDPTAVEESKAAQEEPVEAPQEETKEIGIPSEPESTPAEPTVGEALQPEPEEADAEPMKPVKEEMEAPFEEEIPQTGIEKVAGAVAVEEPVDSFRELESKPDNLPKEPKVVDDEDEGEAEVGENQEEEPKAVKESMAVQDEPIELNTEATREVELPLKPASTSSDPAEEEETSQAVQPDLKAVDAERLNPVREDFPAPLKEETPQNEMEKNKRSDAVDEPLDGSQELKAEPDIFRKEPEDFLSKEGAMKVDAHDIEAKKGEQQAALEDSLPVPEVPVEAEKTREIELPLKPVSIPAEPELEEETRQALPPDQQEVNAKPFTTVDEEVVGLLEEGKPQHEIEKDEQLSAVEGPMDDSQEAHADPHHLEKEPKVVGDGETTEVEAPLLEEMQNDEPAAVAASVALSDEPVAATQQTQQGELALEPESTAADPAVGTEPEHLEEEDSKVLGDQEVAAEVEAPVVEAKTDDKPRAVEKSVGIPEEPVEAQQTREIELPLEPVSTTADLAEEEETSQAQLLDPQDLDDEPLTSVDEEVEGPLEEGKPENEIQNDVKTVPVEETTDGSQKLEAEPADRLEKEPKVFVDEGTAQAGAPVVEEKKQEEPPAVDESVALPAEPAPATHEEKTIAVQEPIDSSHELEAEPVDHLENASKVFVDEGTAEVEAPVVEEKKQEGPPAVNDSVSLPAEPAPATHDEKIVAVEESIDGSQELEAEPADHLEKEPKVFVDDGTAEVEAPVVEEKKQEEPPAVDESVALPAEPAPATHDEKIVSVEESIDGSQELEAEPADHLKKEPKVFVDDGTAEVEAPVVEEKKQEEPPAVDESVALPSEPAPATHDEKIVSVEESIDGSQELEAEPTDHLEKEPKVFVDDGTAEVEAPVGEEKKQEEPIAVDESVALPAEPASATHEETNEGELPLKPVLTPAEPALEKETSQALHPNSEEGNAKPFTAVDEEVVGLLEEGKPQYEIEKDGESSAVEGPVIDSQEVEAEPETLEKEPKVVGDDGKGEVEAPLLEEMQDDKQPAVDASVAIPDEPVAATHEKTQEGELALEPKSTPTEPEVEAEPEHLQKDLKVVDDQLVAAEVEAPVVEAKTDEEPATVEESVTVPEEPGQAEQTGEIELPLEPVSTPAEPALAKEIRQALEQDQRQADAEPLTSVEEETVGPLEEGKPQNGIQKDEESGSVEGPMFESQQLGAEPDHLEKEPKVFGNEGTAEVEAPMVEEKKQDESPAVDQSVALPAEPAEDFHEEAKLPVEPESTPAEPEVEAEPELLGTDVKVVATEVEAPVVEAKTGEESPAVEEALTVPEEPAESEQTREMELRLEPVSTAAEPALEEENSQALKPDPQEVNTKPFPAVDEEVVGLLQEGKPQDEIQKDVESGAVERPMDDSQQLDAEPDRHEKEPKVAGGEGTAEVEAPLLEEMQDDEPAAADESVALPGDPIAASHEETKEAEVALEPESTAADPEVEAELEHLEKDSKVVVDQEVAAEVEAPVVEAKTDEEPIAVEESVGIPEEPVEAEQTREIELPLKPVSTPRDPELDKETSQALLLDPQEVDAEPLASVDEEIVRPLEEGKPQNEIEEDVKRVAVEESMDGSHELEGEPDHLQKEPKVCGDEGTDQFEGLVVEEKKHDEPPAVDESVAVPAEPVAATNEETKEVELPLETESTSAEPELETEVENLEKDANSVDDQEVAAEVEAAVVEAQKGEEPGLVKESVAVHEEPVEAEQSREMELSLEPVSTPAELVADEDTSQALVPDLQEVDTEPLTSVDEEVLRALEDGKPQNEIEEDEESDAVDGPIDDSQELEAEPDQPEKETKVFCDEGKPEVEAPVVKEKKRDEPAAIDESVALPAEPAAATHEESKEGELSFRPESTPAEPEVEVEPEHFEKDLKIVDDQEVAVEVEAPVVESKTGEEPAAVEESVTVPEEPGQAEQTGEIELPLEPVSTPADPALDEEISQALLPDPQEANAEPLTAVEEDVGLLDGGRPQYEIEKDVESGAAEGPIDNSQDLETEPDHLEKEPKVITGEGTGAGETPVVEEKKQDEPLAVYESVALPAEPVAATNEETREVEPSLEPISTRAEPEVRAVPEHLEKDLKFVNDQEVTVEVEAPVVEAVNEEGPEESVVVPEKPVEVTKETKSDPLDEKTPENELEEDMGSVAVQGSMDVSQELGVDLDHLVREPKVHDKGEAEVEVNKAEELATVEEPKAVQEEPEVSPLVENDLQVAVEEPVMVEEGKKDEENLQEPSVVDLEPVEETREIQPDDVDEEPKAVQEEEKEPQAVELESAEASKENTREIEVPLETPASSEETKLNIVHSQVLSQKPERSEDGSLTVAEEEELSAPLEATADADEVKQEKQPAVQEPATAQDEPVVEEELLQELEDAAKEPTSVAEADQDSEVLKEQEVKKVEQTDSRNAETREIELPETPTGIDESLSEEVPRQDQQGLEKMHADPKIVAKEELGAAPLVASPKVDLVKEEEQAFVEEPMPAQLESQVDPELEKEPEVSAQVKPVVVDQEEAETAVLESSPKGKPGNEEEQAAADEPVVSQQDLEISPELEKDAEVAVKELLTESEEDPEVVKEPEAVEVEPVESTREKTREVQLPLELISTPPEQAGDDPSQAFLQEPKEAAVSTDLKKDPEHVDQEEEGAAPLEAVPEVEPEKEKQLAMEEPMAVQEEPEVSPEPEKEVEVALQGEPGRVYAEEEGVAPLEALPESEQENVEDPAAVEERMAAQAEPAVSPELEKEVEIAAKEPTAVADAEASPESEQEKVEDPAAVEERMAAQEEPAVSAELEKEVEIAAKEPTTVADAEALPESEQEKVEDPAAVEERMAAQEEPAVSAELEKEVEIAAKEPTTVADAEALPESEQEKVEDPAAVEERMAAQEEPAVSAELEKEVEIAAKEPTTLGDAEQDPEAVKEPEVIKGESVETSKEETREVELPVDPLSTSAETGVEETSTDLSQEEKEVVAEPLNLVKEPSVGAPLEEATSQNELEKEVELDAVEKTDSFQELEVAQDLEKEPELVEEKEERAAVPLEDAPEVEPETEEKPLAVEQPMAAKEDQEVSKQQEKELQGYVTELTGGEEADQDPVVVEVEPSEAAEEETREVRIPLEPRFTPGDPVVDEHSQTLPQEPKDIEGEALKLLGEEAVPVPLEEETPQHELEYEVESAGVEEPAAVLEELEVPQDLEKEPEVVDEEEKGEAHIGSVFEAESKRDEEPVEEPIAVHKESEVSSELEKEVEAAAKDPVTVAEADPEVVKKPEVEPVEPVDEIREIEPAVSEEEPTLPQDAKLEQAEPTKDETREIEIPLETPSETEASVEKKPSQDAEPEKVEPEPLKSENEGAMAVSLEAAAPETEPEQDEKTASVEAPLNFPEEPVVAAELDKKADVAAEEPVVAPDVEKETEVEPVEPQKQETREIHLPLETSSTPENRLEEEEPGHILLEAPEKMEVEFLKLGEEETEAPEIKPRKDEESAAVEEQFSVQADPLVSSDFEKVAIPEQQFVAPELEKFPEAETKEIGDKTKGDVADELDEKAGDRFLQGIGLDQDVSFLTNKVSSEELIRSELSSDDVSSTYRKAEPLLKALGLQSEVDTCMCASCLYRIFLLKEHSVKIPKLEASKESIDVGVNGLESSTASQVESKTHLDITGDGDNGKWLCGLPVGPGVKDSEASQSVKLNDEQNSVKRLVEELENSLKGQETHPSNGNDPMLDESKDKPTDEPSRLEAGLPSILPSGNLTTVY